MSLLKAHKQTNSRGIGICTDRLGSYTPAFFNTSAKIGTVELTGLEITRMNAFGHALEMEWARVAQIPALI